MIDFDLTSVRVFIAIGNTDMRKSINGLTLIVEEQFEQNLFTGDFFVFCNRKRDIIKILYWAKNGFCIWMKRLEKDSFQWPESKAEILEVEEQALRWLLSGLDLQSAHQKLSFKSAG